MFINPIIRGRVVPKTNTLDVKQSKYILISIHSSHKKKNKLKLFYSIQCTYSLGSSEAEKSMPCTRCFMRTRVVFKTARFKQTALKLSWWIMHVIGSLFASVKADASAASLQHRHSRGWFNVAAVQCEHLHQSRVTNRPKTSSSLPSEYSLSLELLLSSPSSYSGSKLYGVTTNSSAEAILKHDPTTHWRHKLPQTFAKENMAASRSFDSQKHTLRIRIMKWNIDSNPQGLFKWGTK